ncbi:MAG: ABC transporter ATP-binding protein [Elusimicrobia bacterium]|nr:ABC transporter ATP-binding protein [Elusimicrobiota bacterium]
MPETVVEVRELSHRYPERTKDAAPRAALDAVSFDVRRGELFGLLGPNGGGKTTLCRILTTTLGASGGTASILGRDVAKNPSAARRAFGVVFQSPSLDKRLSVRENLTHQGHLYGLSGSTLAKRIDAMLERVRLRDRADDRVEHLSGGLKRRAELAKALLHEPELLILDEPTTGVDPGARVDIWTYLKELRDKQKLTMIVTTHLMEEADRCDRLAILSRGKLVAIGSPDALKGEIGGDVIWVKCKDADRLAAQVRSKFGVSAAAVDGALRVERPNGHEFVPELVEAFPGQVESVTLSKPTLEDVFIRRTNHRFWSEDALEEARA